jgi:hypothetical protein
MENDAASSPTPGCSSVQPGAENKPCTINFQKGQESMQNKLKKTIMIF